MRNMLLASAGGIVLSFSYSFAQYKHQTHFSTLTFIFILALFWVLNIALVILIKHQFSSRLRNPFYTKILMYWATAACFFCIATTYHYHELFYFSLFTIIVFGVFQLSARDFYHYAITVVFGQLLCSLVFLCFDHPPLTVFESIVYLVALGAVMLIMSTLCNTMNAIRQRLRDKNTALKEASRAKELFLANVSHELRTPIFGMIGLIELLEDTPLTNTQKTHLLTAKSSGQHLINLVNDLLDFSKLQEGKISIVPKRFNLAKVLHTLVQSFYGQARKKGVEVILNVDPSLPFSVCGDELRIVQIFSNLIANAIKFTQQGSVAVTVNVTFKANNHCQLYCAVQDSGIGIAENDLSEIFNQFSQGTHPNQGDYGGTGLGLAIVKQLTELMGGELSVDSLLDAGSEFAFQLPLTYDPASLPQVSRLLSGQTIRLVDPIDYRREILQRYFLALGATVDVQYTAIERLPAVSKPSTNTHVVMNWDPGEDNLDNEKRLALLHELANTFKVIVLYSGKPPLTTLPSIECLPKPVSFFSLSQLMTDTPENSQTFLFRPKPVPLPETRQSDSPKFHVLVVEDNAVNQVIVKSLLEKQQITYDLVASGEQALEFMQSTQATIDMILMDCQLPGIDGYALTQKIRQGNAGTAYQSIPIIACTASASATSTHKAHSAGMNDVLPKPFKSQELISILKKYRL